MLFRMRGHVRGLLDQIHTGSTGNALTERAASAARSKFTIGVACGLAAAMIWGGGAVVSRHLVTTSLDPASLTLLRFAGCFPVALLLTLVMGPRLHLSINWSRLIVLLLLAGPLYHALVFAGYRHATAGGGALLLAGLLPIFALGLSFPRNGPGTCRAASVGMVAVTVGLVLFSGNASVTGTGIAIFAIAALAWAVLNDCVRRWRVDPLSLTVKLALLSPLFIPFYLMSMPPQGLSAPAGEMILQLAYHGWLVAIGATALFFASVRLAGAPVAAILQTSSPSFSAAFGALCLGECLELAQAMGLILTLLGAFIALRATRNLQAGRPARFGASSWFLSVMMSFDSRLRLGR